MKWLLILFILAACTQISPPDSEAYETTLAEIEQELSIAKETGGITQERYDAIDQRLNEYEQSGISVTPVRVLLGELTVSRADTTPENVAETHNEQLTRLETEIRDIEARDTLLSQDHSERLLTELHNLEEQGYQVDELRLVVYERSPHLQTKEAEEQTPGWNPPSTCEGDRIQFTTAPVELSEILYIEPMGRVAASHVTPTDHGYIINSEHDNPTISELRSPADGYVLSIGAFPRPNDYRVVIWHSCTIATIYIHIHELAPEILQKTGEIPPGGNWEGDQGPADNRIHPIPVTAGQVIGKIKGGVDFSVHDTTKKLGFVNRGAYESEPWKIHTTDLFDYFEQPLQTQLKEKSLRTIPPVGGTIDYDIDGKLIGNWFREGTDYRGEGKDCTYYECHLAIVYDHVTPSLIRISVPNSGIDECNTCFGAFGVRGNTPDPADVSFESGIVKYELLGLEHVDDTRLNVRAYTRNTDDVLGVFLVEMLDEHRIMVEVFPGKTAGDVDAFTEHARIYER